MFGKYNRRVVRLPGYLDQQLDKGRRAFAMSVFALPLATLLTPAQMFTRQVEGRRRMPGNAPVVLLTADNTAPDPGDIAHLSLAITDPDNQDPETLTGKTTDALGRDVTVSTTTTRVDVDTIRWTVDGAAMVAFDDLTGLSLPIPKDAGGHVYHIQADVTDRQGHLVPAIIDLKVTKPASGLELGCAINKAPDGSKTRSQRWAAFVASIGNAPRLLRVYLSPNDTARLRAAYEANPARTDLWSVISANPDSTGDIWTPGTPHPHNILFSWKPVVDDFNAGLYDGLARSLARQYPGPGKFRITANHEPYDDIYKSGTLDLAKWKQMIGRHVQIFKANEFGHVDVWIVLTGEQFSPANKGTNKDASNFYVPGVHGVASDHYNVPSVRHDGSAWWSPAFMFDPQVAWCRALGVAMGVWEYGVAPDFADPQHRSQNLIAVRDYLVANGGEILSYFDSQGPKGDWYIDLLVHRGAYYPADPLGPIQPPVLTDSLSSATWHHLVSAG